MTNKMPQPERGARRTAAAAMLADFNREFTTTPLHHAPDYMTWSLRLAAALGSVLDAGPEPEDSDGLDDGTEPYCATCGQWCGLFHAIDGWRHFRGDPAPGGQRELYDAGHPAEVAWTDRVLLAPAERQLLSQVFTDAIDRHLDAAIGCSACDAAERIGNPAGACIEHQPGAGRVEAYEQLAARLHSLGLLPDDPQGGAR